MADSNVSTELSHERTGLSHERTGLSHERTDLSVTRTYLSYERTLMSWTRTSASLISFGFTIYKFFQGVRDGQPQQHLLGYSTFSLAMIGIGLISLLMATVQHWRDTKPLLTEYHLQPRYMATAIAALVSALGILGLTAVALRQ